MVLELNRRHLRFAIIAIGVWLVAIVAVLHHGYKQQAINQQIEEITISIGGLQSKLYLPTQQRIKLLDDIELERQLLYAQTLQLKSEPQSWMGLDTTHTVYLLERFMEQLSLLLTDEMRFEQFIDNLTHQPSSLSAEASGLGNQLASIVLNTLYSNGSDPRQVYLKLEQVQHQAFLLSQNEQEQLLKQVAEASSILSQSANTDFLVARTINHPVYNELTRQAKQSQSLLNQQLWAVILLSCLVFSVLLMLAIKLNRQIQNNENQRQSSNATENLGFSQQATTDELIEQDVAMSEELVRQKLMQHNQELVAISEEIDHESQRKQHSEAILTSEITQESEANRNNEASAETTTAKIDFDRMLNTLDNDQTSMLLLLNVFISEHSQDVPDFRQALSQDREKATRVVHTLKGVSGTLFADALRAVAIELEDTLRSGGSVDESQIVKLEHELNTALELVHDYISEHSHE